MESQSPDELDVDPSEITSKLSSKLQEAIVMNPSSKFTVIVMGVDEASHVGSYTVQQISDIASHPYVVFITLENSIEAC